jgi:tetratricopeptide repeat protein
MSEQALACRNEGARLLQAGDFGGALQRLQQAVRQNPRDGEAHGLLGIAQVRQGALASAIPSLQEAARLMPDSVSASYNLAVALFQAQRLPEARAEAQRTLALNPQHPTAGDLIGRINAAQPAPGGAAGGAARDEALSPRGAAPLQDSAATPSTVSLSAFTPPPPDFTPEGVPQAPGAGFTGETPAAQASAPAPSWVGAPAAGFPVPSVPGGAPALQGASFTAPAIPGVGEAAPGVGLRLLRGWLWGILYGQWWTVWSLVSFFLWNHQDVGVGLIVLVVIWVVVYGFFGSLTGLIIGAANLDQEQAGWAGVGVAALAFGLETLLGGFSVVNLVWYFFTGRFIGHGLGARIQHPG